MYINWWKVCIIYAPGQQRKKAGSLLLLSAEFEASVLTDCKS